MAETGKGRKSRERQPASSSRVTGPEKVVGEEGGKGWVDRSVGGREGERTEGGGVEGVRGVRRSSSLGRLGNMRLPSLSLVEIDIDGEAVNPNDTKADTIIDSGEELPKVQQSLSFHGDLSSCGSTSSTCSFDTAVPSPKDVALGLRRTSSFRRRPSLPLLEIISDFGSGSNGSGKVSPTGTGERQRSRSFSYSTSGTNNLSISSLDADTKPSRDGTNVSICDAISLPKTTVTKSSCVKPSLRDVKVTTNNANVKEVLNSPKQKEKGISYSPKLCVNDNKAKGTKSKMSENFSATCSTANSNRKYNDASNPSSPIDHNFPSKSSPRQQRHFNSAERKVPQSPLASRFNSDRISTSARDSAMKSLTPTLSHKFDRVGSPKLSHNFSVKSSVSNHDISSASPTPNHDFNRRRSSSLKREFGRTSSPKLTHRDFGRRSPMLNYNDVFGNSSDITRSQMSNYDAARTSSPVTFLQANGTSGNNRDSPKPLGIAGNNNRNSPLLRSNSSSDFKMFPMSPEITPRSRRGSQGSQSSEGAREMLEAALEQMDDLIANNSFDLSFDDDRSSLASHNSAVSGITRLANNAPDRASYVNSLVMELRHVLETTENPDNLKTSLPRDTLLVIRDWLIPDVDEIFSMVNVRSQHSEETVRRLEEDRHSLTLQVSVLTDQVEAQAEKIREMEMLMEEDKRRIMDANDILQQELLSRSHLESHKLELMSEVSGLKLRLASAEKDRRELDDRCRAAQRQAAELEAKLVMKDAENSELRMRLSRNGTLPLDTDNTEIEKLKRAVDTLMLANEEKERKMEDLRRLLRRYRRVEEILVQAQGRKAVEELLSNVEDGDTSSNSSSTTPSVGDHLNLRPDQSNATSTNHLSVEDRTDGRHYISSPSATSTPVHVSNENSRLNASFHGSTNGSTPPVMAMGANSRQALGLTRSNSCENLVPGKAPPGKGDHHNTLGGRGGGGGSMISPGYANSEVVTDDEDGLQHYGPGQGGETKKRRGLRRLFGRLKRSSSQDLEGSRDRRENNLSAPGDFRRGGVRATATARLAWNRDVKGRISNPDIPFTRWDTDRITAWLNDIGLNMYLVDCKRWVRNGEQLLRCSQHDLEKELGMKNSLHRKKLTLAMQAVSTARPDLMGDLDHNFVARWLDDIGLPQYKDSFYDARVDARMLNSLTVEDLFHLKVSNEVHHVSIRRGIQALRLNNFDPNALRRRPAPEEQKHMDSIPGEVVLWTNHRVMEWLRTIDLSEYAPNLRGSGVHGALMILEPRFNSELFAILLSIPASKTLLRRHLNSHFIGLIGAETQQRKRELESQPDFMPLLHNNKIKKGKFGLFNHKRSRSEPEMDSLICPPDINGYQHNNGKVARCLEYTLGILPMGRPSTHYRNLSLQSPIGVLASDRPQTPLDLLGPFCYYKKEQMASGIQKKPNEKAAKEIGAFSQEINSLTSMLSHERFMDSAKTSNV